MAQLDGSPVTGGPLAGLRVIDLTGDLGRFGAKLLAELGADVVRPRGAGSRGRPLPGRAAAWGGVLDWWFDSAKEPVAALDLSSDDGRTAYRRVAASTPTRPRRACTPTCWAPTPA